MTHYGLVLVILAVLAGCAGQPHPAAPAAGAGVASRPGPTATPAVAGALAASGIAPSATAAPAAKTDGTAAAEFKPPSGWKTRVNNGKTVYCRRDTSVASRIPVQYCLTQADLREFLSREKQGVEDIDQMRAKAPSMCAAGQTCN
jgi:hypothetical protein